jgi:hypothetical protein
VRGIRAIFRKDIYRLWPVALAFQALLLLRASIGFANLSSDALGSLVLPLLSLGAIVLVVMVIQEDPLMGDHCWLTRPYSRLGLAAAKLSFIVVFVNLPSVIASIGVFVAVGIRPQTELLSLFLQQLVIITFIVLPAAALASVTSSLREAVAVSLGAFAALDLLTVCCYLLENYDIPTRLWQLDYWPARLLAMIISLVICCLTLVVQYVSRSTILGRMIFFSGIVSVIASVLFFPRQKEFEVRSAWFGSKPDLSSVQFRLAGARTPPKEMMYSRERRRSGIVHLEIPVRLEGLASDLDVLLGRCGPTTFKSQDDTFHGVPVLFSAVREAPRKSYWLSLDLDAFSFRRLRSLPVSISTAVEVTSFRPTADLPASQTTSVPVPKIGVCRSLQQSKGHVAVECLSPFPRASLCLRFPGGGKIWIIDRSNTTPPIPESNDFYPLVGFVSPVAFSNIEELSAIRLVVEKPVRHEWSDVTIKQIRLSDYLHAE